jgi:hypothetical protein
MISNARYVHTNLIAHDWQALARFYQDVFGCVVVPPERDFRGKDLDAGTGLSVRTCAVFTCACPVTATTAQPSKSSITSH